jgi:hypothetical protein
MTPHNGYRKNRRRMSHVLGIIAPICLLTEMLPGASERTAGKKGPTGLASQSEMIARIGGGFFCVSHMVADCLLGDGNRLLVAPVHGPALDTFCAHKSRRGQDAHMLAE